jgi:hypothetical protein
VRSGARRANRTRPRSCQSRLQQDARRPGARHDALDRPRPAACGAARRTGRLGETLSRAIRAHGPRDAASKLDLSHPLKPSFGCSAASDLRRPASSDRASSAAFRPIRIGRRAEGTSTRAAAARDDPPAFSRAFERRPRTTARRRPTPRARRALSLRSARAPGRALAADVRGLELATGREGSIAGSMAAPYAKNPTSAPTEPIGRVVEAFREAAAVATTPEASHLAVAGLRHVLARAMAASTDREPSERGPMGFGPSGDHARARRALGGAGSSSSRGGCQPT